MKYKDINLYESPEVKVLMIKSEHGLCASGSVTVKMNEDDGDDILWGD